MNISLRKAAALQTAINDVVKGIKFEVTVDINEFQGHSTEMNRVLDNLKTNIARREGLIGALYELRSAVNHANYGAGINDKLAAVARLEKDIQFYQGLAGNQASMDLAVIEGKLEKIRARPADARSIYGYDDKVTTSVLKSTDLDEFRKAASVAKKQKQKIQDELLEANIRNQVELSAATVAVLTAEQLL